jgi:hypothetical protein
MEEIKHFKFKVPVSGYVTLYMHGIHAYDAIERVKNDEGGKGWSEMWGVEKHLDDAEIINESNEPPQFIFTDVKGVRVNIIRPKETC